MQWPRVGKSVRIWPQRSLRLRSNINAASSCNLHNAYGSYELTKEERSHRLQFTKATMHGTSRPCLRGTVERVTHECCRVERANNSNAFDLFFEQESQPYLIFTMIRTPSSYGNPCFTSCLLVVGYQIYYIHCEIREFFR